MTDDGLDSARQRTVELVAALERHDIEGPYGARAMLTHLGQAGELSVMLMTWAKVLAMFGPSADHVFAGHAAANQPWFPHAIALVEAAITAEREGRDSLPAIAAPLKWALADLDDEQIWQLTWAMLIEVHALTSTTGGLPVLQQVRSIHQEACEPGEEWLAGRCSVIVATAMHGRLPQAHEALTALLATSRTTVTEVVSLWLFLAATLMTKPGEVLLQLDATGTPHSMIDPALALDAGVDEQTRSTASVMAAATRAITGIQAGDLGPMEDLARLSEAERMILAWNLAGSLALQLRRQQPSSGHQEV
ncbi:hypothetical protein AB0F17_59515 [Nonomuraea sp. NPDC026600]|uniref:hypothetical protein n=1 Tax=Nonomuraea sp. NPDC026600 TaxID=3155363 RepID=UPI0033E41E64